MIDRYGRTWPDNMEFCPECGQPDNCGDCEHQPITSRREKWAR